MAFTLEKVVPWGRLFDEYVAIFALDSVDLSRRILGCGDGPAAFNATHTARGGSVVSVDPIYQFSSEEISRRIVHTYNVVMEETRKNKDEFVWSGIRSLEELGRMRMNAMNMFLEDYEQGKEEGRYIPAELPALPFADGQFGIALCSHLLFLYSEQMDLEFHIRSLRELCRVSREVRVFPLLELGSRRSRHVDAVQSMLRSEGFQVDIRRVDYEFQKGGNEMLRVANQPRG